MLTVPSDTAHWKKQQNVTTFACKSHNTNYTSEMKKKIVDTTHIDLEILTIIQQRTELVRKNAVLRQRLYRLKQIRDQYQQLQKTSKELK